MKTRVQILSRNAMLRVHNVRRGNAPTIVALTPLVYRTQGHRDACFFFGASMSADTRGLTPNANVLVVFLS